MLEVFEHVRCRVEEQELSAFCVQVLATPSPLSSFNYSSIILQVFGHLCCCSQMLDILCRILQTNSIPVVQAWMRHASESGK